MIAGGWRLTVGAAVLVTGALVAPTAAQAEAGCEWIRTDLPFPAGVQPGGLLVGDGDWIASTNWSRTTVVWHREVPATVTFPAERSPYDINRNGVLLSSGGDGLWRGEEKLLTLPGRTSSVHSMNTDGEVVGKSGDALAVWPAGDTTPRLLEGTDDGRSWEPKGIDDEGNVIGSVRDAGVSRGYVWNRQGERVELQPMEGHDQVFPSLIRDGRSYGISAVRGEYQGIAFQWNLRGEIVRVRPGGEVLAINDAGDQMVRWGSGAAVRRSNGHVDPLPDDVFPDVLTENGDVFGGRYFEGPVRLRCA